METNQLAVNTEFLERLVKLINDPDLTDKRDNTLADWLRDYGATEESDLTITFGSTYALSKMIARRDKEVIRCILSGLGLYENPV